MVFISAVCQPAQAKSSHDVTNEWLHEMIEASEKREAEKQAKLQAEMEQARIEAEKKAAAEKTQAKSNYDWTNEMLSQMIEASEKREAEKQAKLQAEKEQARIEAEKKAAAEREQARIEAEKKAVAEREQARIEAEKKAAAEKEQARIEAEKKAAAEKEQARIEAEKRKVGNKTFFKDQFATVDPQEITSLANRTLRMSKKAVKPSAQKISHDTQARAEENTDALLEKIIPVIPFEKKENVVVSTNITINSDIKAMTGSALIADSQNKMPSEPKLIVSNDVSISSEKADKLPKRLGKYDLKTGEAIETLPTSVEVGNMDFLIAEDPIPYAKEPITGIEEIATETLDIEGTNFLIGYVPGLEQPQETIQSDLKELMDDLDQTTVSKIEPTSQGLSAEDQKSLMQLLEKTDSVKKVSNTSEPVQQDLLDLLDSLKPEQTVVQLSSKENSEKSSSDTPAVLKNQVEQELGDLLSETGETPSEVKKEKVSTVHSAIIVPSQDNSKIIQSNQSIAQTNSQDDLDELLAAIEEDKNVSEKSASIPSESVNSVSKILPTVSQNNEETVPSNPTVTAKSSQDDLGELLTTIEEDKNISEKSASIPSEDVNGVSKILPTASQNNEETVPSNPTITAKSAQSDLNELLTAIDGGENEKTDKKTVFTSQDKNNMPAKVLPAVSPSGTEEKLSFFQKVKRSMMGLLACGVLMAACGFMSKVKHEKEPTPKQPIPKEPESIPSPAEAKKQTVQKKNLSPEEAEKRKKLAAHIVDVKVLSEIKEKRASLTREMAKAKRRHDEVRIEEIKAERQRLTEKKKAICLRLTGSQRDEIKEKRRLLTKQMTIARRRNDEATKQQIMIERQKLNAKVKALNQFVQKVDYQQMRKAHLKPEVLALLQARRNALVRAA